MIQKADFDLIHVDERGEDRWMCCGIDKIVVGAVIGWWTWKFNELPWLTAIEAIIPSTIYQNVIYDSSYINLAKFVQLELIFSWQHAKRWSEMHKTRSGSEQCNLVARAEFSHSMTLLMTQFWVALIWMKVRRNSTGDQSESDENEATQIAINWPLEWCSSGFLVSILFPPLFAIPLNL